MTTAIKSLAQEHAHSLVHPVERTVEIPYSVANDFMIAMAEDGENLEDLIFQDRSSAEYVMFFADMMRAFAGQISHKDFFTKYDAFFEEGKRVLSEDWEAEIWNAYVDEYNPAPLDPYDYYGVKRSDF